MTPPDVRRRLPGRTVCFSYYKGGAKARRRVLEIANDADLRVRAPKAKFGPDVTLDPKLSVSRKVASALDPRLPPPGTYLEREYKGRRIIVKILVNGF